MTIKFKKSSVLFLLFFAAIMSVQAQEMSVKSFEYLEKDLTARTNRRNDINDNPAAVIRVGIALQGVEFEGNVLGEPVYKKGEYLVYMSAGSRKLTVRHQNFVPLEVTFADYGIKQLEGLSTYRLTILTSTPNAPAPQPTGNFLVLNVNPTTARVTIDDQEPRKVNADGTFKSWLTNGSHNVTVEADDFLPQTVMVNMGSTRQQMDINLVSSLSTLILKTGTAGAQIYIDEELKGTDQWQGLLAAGTYMVESRKEGYRSASLMVTVNQKQTETVKLPPLEKIYGALYVDVEPIDAEIYLDGKLLGKAPNLFNDVPIGKHRVRISKLGYVDRIDDVEIFENKQTKINGSIQREDKTLSPLKETSGALLGDKTLSPFTVNGVTFYMVKVAGGTFTMGATAEQGDDNERPAHKVTLTDYYIGQTEVTQALWTAVMGSNPSFYKGDNLPVEKVSWDDCQTFIDKLNSLFSNELGGMRFALPTEAQWEFAARGGKKSKGYKYAGGKAIDDVAWFEDNSAKQTHPVAQKQPNELGLYDMSGNVEEWCQDWYDEGYYRISPENNPQGPASGTLRVLRGGSWFNFAKFCRVSYRGRREPSNSQSGFGLRLCLLPVSVNQKQTETVTFPPLEKGYGALNVDVEPIDAEVYLDGKLLGTAPDLFNDIPIGKHRVLISKPGYADRMDDVEIFENKQTKINGSLQRGDKTLVPFTVNGVTFKMVKVEGGTFTMGATKEQGKNAYDEERPAHQVTLSDYYIGQTEVTQELWTAVMGSNPSEFKGDNLPVTDVSWVDCQAFIEKLNRLLSNELGGKRFALPTESQWEFAARGGNKSKGYKYAGSNNLDDVAWFWDNRGEQTHPVAQKQPNELGLYDMSGNVWEWCKDWYGRYSRNAQTNPQGPASGTNRVYRGGSWLNSAEYCRVSNRNFNKQNNRQSDLGFRLCLIP